MSFDELRRALDAGDTAVLFTVLEGEHAGTKLLVREGADASGDAPPELAHLADELLREGRSRTLDWGGSRVFAEVYAPPTRLVVVGAVDTAEALCAAASQLGWHTIVADARARFATSERLPSADRIVVAWPEEAFAEIEPDYATAVVVLTHDEKFDVPALAAALASDAFYVGALGSRRAQEGRRARLLEAGVAEEELSRIHGPCGLDVGAESPAETALSILAEILAVRVGRPGGKLRDARTRIHADREPMRTKLHRP
jgi:xanthine dehydrogenase accessory factor